VTTRKYLAVFILLVLITAKSIVLAQGNNYTQTNLVSSVPGVALTIDDELLHPWGVAVSTNQAFRVAANLKGQFRSYDASGQLQDPRGVIAVPEGVTLPANPTGVAANTTELFVPSSSLASPFLFATRQGTISSEYADDRGDIKTTTILVIDHGSQGAQYTGLAILTPDCCAPYLAVTDFHRGFVETFTSFFDPLGIPGAFVDPNLPTGYAPWNIQVVGNKVFVAYALQDVIQHDPAIGPGNGVVDIYNLDGSFERRFASNGPLNAPSGMVRASANFGAFSNDILIGNYGDGRINAFDPNTGQFLGSLKDGNGNPISDPELHSMVFGDTNAGAADTLFLTAGLRGGNDGVFASIAVNNSGAGPDFSLTAPSSSVNVMPGQTANFSVTATPVGNFRGLFSFGCTAPAALSCSVGPPSVDPATGAATVAVEATASPTTASSSMAMLALPGILLAGLGRRRFRRGVSLFVVLVIGALVLTVAGVTGCGSNGGSSVISQPTMRSFSVTATSGSVSHTTVLTLNVQ
jgi:uncharacterized protein (TIGR03118 family)